MANNTCYSSTGTTTNDTPCGIPGSNQCCGSGWDCLNNGLCQQHGTTAYSQGTCTNQNYDNCLSFCNVAAYEGATEVSSCGTNSWCCAGEVGLGAASGTNCCDTSSTTSLEPYPYATVAADQSGSTSTAKATSTTRFTSFTSATRSTAQSSSPSSSQSSSVVLFSQSTTLQTSTSQSISSSSTSTPTPSPAGNSGLALGAKIGIGIAVPLAVLLLAALAFFIYKSRKQAQRLKALQNGEKDGTHEQSIPEVESERQAHMPELADHGRHEMPERGEVPELGGKGVVRELSGRQRHEMDTTRS